MLLKIKCFLSIIDLDSTLLILSDIMLFTYFTKQTNWCQSKLACPTVHVWFGRTLILLSHCRRIPHACLSRTRSNAVTSQITFLHRHFTPRNTHTHNCWTGHFATAGRIGLWTFLFQLYFFSLARNPSQLASRLRASFVYILRLKKKQYPHNQLTTLPERIASQSSTKSIQSAWFLLLREVFPRRRPPDYCDVRKDASDQF